jgi:hypothetical protein
LYDTVGSPGPKGRREETPKALALKGEERAPILKGEELFFETILR